MSRVPLLWMAISFIFGIVSGDFFSFYPLLTLSLIIFFFLAEHFFRFLRSDTPRYLWFFLFFWGGFLSNQWVEFYLPGNDISRWIDRKIVYTGVIDEAVAHYQDHTTLLLKTQQVETNGQTISASGRIKLNINKEIPFPLAFGDQIKVPLLLREPHGFKNMTGFDYGLYLERHGIRATASLTHPEEITVVQKNGGNFILRKVYEWREEIRKKAIHTLKGEDLAIYLAIIIGESGYLTNEIRDAFMASGTTHILSISGSHLALVAFLVFNLTRLSLLHLPERMLLTLGKHILPSKLALCLTIPPVMLYGLLAGNQVATNRSMMMIGIFIVGQFLNREQNLLNALAFSALAILLFDPLAIYDISFQLSFGSVLSIAVVLIWLNQEDTVPSGQFDTTSKKSFISRGRIQKWIENMKSYCWISLATSVGTAPLVAYHFNQFNWVGILANAIIIPLVGFIIVPIALISAFFALIFSSSGLYFGSINNFLFSWFYKIVKAFALFPFAEIHLSSPPIGQIALFFSLVLIFLYADLLPKFKVVIVTMALLFPFWWYFGPQIHFKSKELKVTFLDVGQGDSAYMEFPDGKNMLIDGGGVYHEFDVGRLVVAPFLWNRGIHHIDYLVATHPQADHIGGLVYILKKFSIGEVWTNGSRKETRIAENFNRTIQDRFFDVKVVQNGTRLKLGEVDLEVLNPHLRDPIASSGNAQENNEGIVMKVLYHSRSVLFAADIEKEAEERILLEEPRLNTTLLKVPHHGGKSSADPVFIETLSPEISIFSVGYHNSYHHPSPEALQLYQQVNSAIFRTDRDGALLFVTDGDSVQKITATDLMPHKVPLNRAIFENEWENLKKLRLRHQVMV